MRSIRVMATLSGALLLVVVAAWLSLGFRAQLSHHPQGPDPASLVYRLRLPQNGHDAIPRSVVTNLRRFDIRLELSTARLLWASPTERHWLVTTTANEVCHLVTVKSLASSACVSRVVFATHGISSTVRQGRLGVRSAVLPDGYRFSFKNHRVRVRWLTRNLVEFPFNSRYGGEQFDLTGAAGGHLVLYAPPPV